ncbi:MAG: glutamine-hydrolyzing carbamoyl-phosphate synthase small subunit [Bacteroidetes bacterium]|nr:glutamine-hydrolyzing carbamoyl-phosphate synthase small subunit [Bacteroidota bacterium]
MSVTSPASTKPAFLLLEDGTFFNGISFGAEGTRGGEICFNTGMTGYQEVFTDPSYTGQLLIMNTAYVGNYGVKKEDVESSSVKIRGLICKNISERYSRMQASGDLADYLRDNNIVALEGVDTRALVQHIRNKGTMNGIISTEFNDIVRLRERLKLVPQMSGLDLSQEVSTNEAYTYGSPDATWRVAVLDFGLKQSMLRNFAERQVYLKIFPAHSSVQEMLAFKPDGFFVSNGPGDPAAMDYAVQSLKDILATGIPMFGICLGHQLLARTQGIPTFKMHHGHRGLNHPVKNLLTGKSEITTQNHGFVVDGTVAAQTPHVEITHLNLNDGTIEGLRLTNKPAFSVQYHPESTPGTFDSRYLFDEFITMMQAHKH